MCSKGFHLWQNYADAVQLLRALFRLATPGADTAKDPQARALTQHARAVVLQLAEGNTPLFITTISLDIMDPKFAEHRSSTMLLVTFIIRKNPLVLYPNLTRLIEAVVKSLDPNSTAGRDAVIDSVIDILGQIVRTYPSIDFHMQTQHLAVGTSEGAVIMYDLKTASRLYVLEGHKRRLTACSFSPDGRRLVTLSLDEGVAMVWKVGGIFVSFFMPGVMPRQVGGALSVLTGGSVSDGTAPFRTFPFNVGSQGVLTLSDTFTAVKFEWPSARSARASIGENVFTFAT